jgi:hypothetical protein
MQPVHPTKDRQSSTQQPVVQGSGSRLSTATVASNQSENCGLELDVGGVAYCASRSRDQQRLTAIFGASRGRFLTNRPQASRRVSTPVALLNVCSRVAK